MGAGRHRPYDGGMGPPCVPGAEVMSVMRTLALAALFAAGLGPAGALAQSPLPPTESSLAKNPALVRDWADRLLSKDAKVRATAEAALAKGARRSLPLLRQLLKPEHEELHAVTLEV